MSPRSVKSRSRPAKKPAGQPLLVEVLTEELPPRALARLMEAFSHGMTEALRAEHFLLPDSETQPFATPRRLAVRVSQVLSTQPDRVVERKGPAVASALDADGQPTPALRGFAKSCGVDASRLERATGDKGDYFVYRQKQKGEPLKKHLAQMVEAVLRKLPAPKTMRWGAGEVQFIRPVHGVMLVHGRQIVPGTVLGLKSSNKTRGHRFLSKGVLTVGHAKDYEKILNQQGKVTASFEARREAIARGLDAAAHQAGKGADAPSVARAPRLGPIGEGLRWDLGKAAELVDEVTSLVETPAVYIGHFDPAFLDVPKECLIISMQQHQKYFPLANAKGALQAQFLFVSNMPVRKPKEIIHGNQRVLRARLADARFFYDQDRKTKLETRVPRLASVVYHNKLGSQLERVERLVKLAGEIARQLGADIAVAERAAYLAKGDLLADMVGEFPELQGSMGRYYAGHDGESPGVALAIEQHYWPRFAGDGLPQSPEAAAVALADRLDSLAGMFGIGQQPTGDKDPFGLRRAALAVIRIVLEKDLPLKLNDLVGLAFSHLPKQISPAHTDLQNFIFDRLAGYFRDAGFSAQEIDAVLSLRPVDLAELPKILKALQGFQQLPEAAALAAANKRIVNILRKAGPERMNTDAGRLVEPAELTLFNVMQTIQPEVEACVKKRDYTGALQRLAALKQPVDTFFDAVMVMAEDPQLRDNRLALLGDLKGLMNRVADISRLAI